MKKGILEHIEEESMRIRSLVEASEDEEESLTAKEFLAQIDEEMLEEFVDAILLKIAELSLNGKLDIGKAKDIKSVAIHIVKLMAQRSAIIGKMSQKYYSLGDRRVLRKAYKSIGKTLG